jgi:hypothetical protein
MLSGLEPLVRQRKASRGRQLPAVTGTWQVLPVRHHITGTSRLDMTERKRSLVQPERRTRAGGLGRHPARRPAILAAQHT